MYYDPPEPSPVLELLELAEQAGFSCVGVIGTLVFLVPSSVIHCYRPTMPVYIARAEAYPDDIPF